MCVYIYIAVCNLFFNTAVKVRASTSLSRLLSHTTSRTIVTPITQLLVSPNWIIPPFSVLLPTVLLRRGSFDLAKSSSRSPIGGRLDLLSRFKNFPHRICIYIYVLLCLENSNRFRSSTVHDPFRPRSTPFRWNLIVTTSCFHLDRRLEPLASSDFSPFLSTSNYAIVENYLR